MPTEPLPGLSRLGQLLESFTSAGLAIRQRTAGRPRPLPPATDPAAYRIIQEGLTNAHKHGRDHEVRLLPAYGPGALDITVRNAMRAGPAPAGGTGLGLGLTGMRERARATGGFLSAVARPAHPGMDRLTKREREVLGLVAGGLSNDDIARRLYVSPHTAKTHVNRIMTKLGARDRAQLVVVAYQTGFTRFCRHLWRPGV
ncbi:helix-turn-helix transcriptional regulator [Streptomyces paludis]|uniref:helix-turn-helix transcriptional regulator n=1 Tax=Streptomyces paludis TaxID=2282738 RepID=UPI001E4C3ACB|nr:LuxR C-terminal-related transcriptional regulator [Streptomyces paludis]